MISVRMFAAPTRQCWGTAAASLVRASQFSNIRYYSVPVGDKVAKFKGQKGPDGKYTVTLIEGDGIGPEISQSVKDIFAAAKARQSRQA